MCCKIVAEYTVKPKCFFNGDLAQNGKKTKFL
jgi:hypothetical protein